ncbi:MAG: putative ATPase [Nevskia sp.]|nr:putative ATPase [Nevskia sp.]
MIKLGRREGPSASVRSDSPGAETYEPQIVRSRATPAPASLPRATMTAPEYPSEPDELETISDGMSTTGSDAFSFGPFKLFPARRLLQRNGETVKLGGRAFDILVLLVNRASEVVAHREIHATVWSGLIVDEGSLRFHVSALRKALGDGQPDVRYLVNVPGRGYCFVAPVTHLRTTDSALKPSASSSRSGSRTLPPVLARMVGRAETVHEVGIRLLAERFVTIVGPGGMGKTTVAVAFGHTVLTDFAAAVQFVDLCGVKDARQVAATIAVTIGLQVFTENPVPEIVAILQHRRMLLILDNCEHLAEPVASVAEQIFRHAPDVYILATSREPLNAEGERVFRLRPLQMPPEGVAVTAQEASAYPAVQMFLERARAGGTQVDLDDDVDVAAVVDICRRLDGIALAIELAAGRVQAYGIHKTAELLGQQFSLLWPGRRTALPRHQTLSATLDWSYNLLSPAERRLLYRLSVFVDAFDLEAIGAVALAEGDNLERIGNVDVSGLVAKSLAVAEPDSPDVRYRLLETTRNYALRKLAESGESREISHRHARYHERILFKSAQLEQSIGEWPHCLASKLNDIRAAMDWAMSSLGDTLLGIRLAAYSASIWLSLGLLPECRTRMAQALERLDASEATPEEQILIQMALGAAVMFTVGMGEEFTRTWTRVLLLAEVLGDSKRQLIAYLTLWAQQVRAGDLDQARRLARRCAAVAEKSGQAGGRPMARWMLGLCEQQQGNYKEARRLLEEALATDDEEDRQLQIRHFGYDRRIDGLGVLSHVLLMQGSAAEALEMSGMAIAEARQLDFPIPFCIAQSWHSFNLYLVGAEWSEIERHAGTLIQHAQRCGIEAYHGFGMCIRALSGSSDTTPEATAEAIVAGTRLLSRGQCSVFNPLFQAEGAMALAAAGLHAQADALFAMMVAEDRNPEHWCRPEILRIKGELALGRGRAEEAERWFGSAIELATQHGSSLWQLRAAISLAKLWVKQDRKAQVDGLLSPLLGEFAEGIVSRDLQEARAMTGRAKRRYQAPTQ